MNRAILLFLLSTLLSSQALAAEPAKPPPFIREHFEWCAAAPRNSAAALARWEGFWRRYDPKDVGYEDAVHAKYLRRCAYRLAGLYALRGNAKGCLRMVAWLEQDDQALQ